MISKATLCSHGTGRIFDHLNLNLMRHFAHTGLFNILLCSHGQIFKQSQICPVPYEQSLLVIENQPKNKSGFFQTRDTLISIGHVNMSVATHKVIYHQKSTVPPISASPRALLKRMLRGTLSVCKMNPLTSLRSCDPGDSCQMSNLPSPLMLRTWDK